MNSETMLRIEEFMAQAGAVTSCERCHVNEVYAYDDAADRQVYAMATNAFKQGDRAFSLMTLEEVRSCVNSALAHSNHQCPSCGRDDA